MNNIAINARINEINSLIPQLERERTELLNRKDGMAIKEIKELSWTKDCIAYLHINDFVAGLSCSGKYEIYVEGKTPWIHDQITIAGDDSFPSNNLMLKSSFLTGNVMFHTSNKELLFDFLKTVEFKQFSYDREKVKFFEKIARIADLRGWNENVH